MQEKEESQIEKIKRIVLDYKFSTLLSILFVVIVLCQQQTFHVVILSLISSLSLFFFIFLVAKINLRWIRYILTSCFAAIVTLDFVCAIIYNSVVNVNIIGSIFETSKGEAIGMLGDISLPLIGIIVITFTLIFGAVSEFRKTKFSIAKATITYSIFFVLFSAFNIVSESYQLAKVYASNKRFDFGSLKWNLTNYPSHTIMQIYSARMTIAYSDIFVTAYYLKERNNYKHYLLQNRSLIEGMTLDNDARENDIEKIFFVIGESASPMHMSLYGYDIPTTPNMDKLVSDTTSAVKFNYYSAITSHLLTRIAVTLMLSADNVLSEQKDLQAYKNLIELANENGYETIWVSNQKKLGPYDGYIPIIGTYATHSVHNLQKQTEDILHYDDNELLPYINNYYRENKKQVFFIHLEGSHRAFSMRYDDEDRKNIIGETDSAHYDRTIHHTDRFLQNIYQIMPNNSVMIYIYIRSWRESSINKWAVGQRSKNTSTLCPIYCCGQKYFKECG